MHVNNRFMNKLLSKNGISSVLYAQILLSKSVGDRIETVEFYALQLKVGRGTVQYAMKFLTAEKAVMFESRGHKGTFISYIDYNILIQIAGLNTITCSMPLPYTLRYEGLATGLYEMFQDTPFDFNMAYVRGSKNRINHLLDGKVDFTFVSNYTADIATKENKGIVLIEELSDFTFVGKRALLFRDKTKSVIEDGMKVAVDKSSTDQISLTEYLCKDKKVTFINVSYNQIYSYLENNMIDVAVWNGDEFYDKKVNGSAIFIDNIDINDTRASLIGLSNNYSINILIKKFINKEMIENIQQKVINREKIPLY